MANLPDKIESERDLPKAGDWAGIAQRWLQEIKLAQKEFEPWTERVEKIVRRYRDERAEGMNDNAERLNILWSTVQTTIPAIYQRDPRPEVARRFKAKDPAARVASLIVERYLSVDLERDGIGTEMRSVVLDRELGARGVAWIEYEPVIRPVPTQVVVREGANGEPVTGEGRPYTGGTPQQQIDGSFLGEMEFEQVVDVRAPVRYVFWRDFLHSPARCWREVRWVARKHSYTRDECEKKFADGLRSIKWKPEDIPLNETAVMGEKLEKESGDLFKRAAVWEIWPEDADGKKDADVIIYVVDGMQVPLDVKKKPVRLEASRFPCPEPYYGTTTTDSLVPVPDFAQIQDLSDEIDDLTSRICSLTKAVKVCGAYDAANPELQTILNESVDNDMFPVQNWRLFMEGGGFAGGAAFLPVENIVAALGQLQEQRANRIEMLYQVSGFSDLLRGQSDPRTTASAERIKSNFGSLRIQEKQDKLAAFAGRLLQIKAEIIVETAPPEVLRAVSSIDDDQQDSALVSEAIALLKDERMRDFKVEVTERSLAALDRAEEKAERMEFLNAAGGFIDKFAQSASQMPEMLDVGAELLQFGVRGFGAGREVEGAVDAFIQAMRTKAEEARKKAGQPPPPPPEVQLEQMKSANELKLEDTKNRNKLGQIQQEQQLATELEKAQALSQAAIEEFKAQAKEQTAQMQAQIDLVLERTKAEADQRLAVLKEELKRESKEREDARDAMMLRGMRAKRVLKETPEGEFYSEVEDDDEGAALQ